jgi:AcrR family transcriptional regulator
MTGSRSTDHAPRSPGRPRSFTDEDAFEATKRVLLREGAQGVTLADVARELDCTGQALNARFGSRRSLLIAYSEWASDRQLARFRDVRAAHASPLRSLRARFELPLAGREDELADTGGQIQLLSMMSEAREDSEFAARHTHRAALFEQEMAILLEEAVTAGELSADTDPGEVAHLLLTSMVGASALWSVTAQGSVVAEVLRVVDRTLAPYIVQTPSPGTDS